MTKISQNSLGVINHEDLADMPDVAGTNPDHDARYYTKNELNSTIAPSGASLIGVEDVGGFFAGADVEAVLQEIAGVILPGEYLRLDGTNIPTANYFWTTDLTTTGNLQGTNVTGTTSVVANTMTLATGSITDTTGAISFGNENLSTTGNIRIASDTGLFQAGATITDYTFGWNGTDAIHTITAGDFAFMGGNVGIGTATPTHLLDANLGSFNAGGKSVSRVLPSVNSGTYYTLLHTDGTALSSDYHYKIMLDTTPTGTNTGASYLVYYDLPTTAWIVRLINIAGTGSNHPEVFLDGGVPKVKTSHVNLYPVNIITEAIYTGEDAATANMFGADYQWQRSTNYLYYNDGNVGIGTNTPLSTLSVGGSGVAGAAVYGTGTYGVRGEGSSFGVYGLSITNYGVAGFSNTGKGGYFNSGADYACQLRRNTTDTNVIKDVFNIIADTSANMVDGFGCQAVFTLEDSGGTFDVGAIAFRRDGADDNSEFQVRNYNGGVLKTPIVADTNGRITFENQSGSRAYQSVDQVNIVSGTWTKVLFNTENYDFQNEFASSRYTCVKPGVYIITASIKWEALGDGDTSIIQIRNNNVAIANQSHTMGAATSNYQAVSTIVYLNTNNYIELWCWHNHGSNRNLDYSETGSNHFAVHKIA